MALVVILGLIIIASVVLFIGPKRIPSRRLRGDIDEDVLSEAEDEVRGLDAMKSPDDAADSLPDWGPGAPKKGRR